MYVFQIYDDCFTGIWYVFYRYVMAQVTHVMMYVGVVVVEFVEDPAVKKGQ